MADFKTHITVSTTLGIGYGAAAFRYLDMPVPTCVLAGTLCSVSGMLPDLDSDSGVPLRESLAFASACVPMLLIDRFREVGWSHETTVLVGAALYAAVRFGMGSLLKRYTVHRGMFHSIPAMLIAGETAFLLSSGDFFPRAYKTCAVMLGFLSHLLLDELWSIKVSRGRIGLKSSSGTALKLWGSDGWANLSTYAKLALLGVLVFKDPVWTTVDSAEVREAHSVAAAVVREFEDRTNIRLPGAAPSPPPPTTTPTGAAPSLPSPQQAPPTQYVAPSPYGVQPYVPPQYAPPGLYPPGYYPAPPGYASPAPPVGTTVPAGGVYPSRQRY